MRSSLGLVIYRPSFACFSSYPSISSYVVHFLLPLLVLLALYIKEQPVAVLV